MAIKGEYRLCLGDDARPIYKALLAEVRAPSPEKGEVSVSIERGCLVLEISSQSLSGFRALTNSFLLLVHAAYSAISEAGKQG
ncbi:MAG: hypothetical protein F7C33_03590 [Desulfurococcales archaeon]|nr:hypothetical protein [Desulfurococcales archaeon]